MIHLTLQRVPAGWGTPGTLSLGGTFLCYTLEDADRQLETAGSEAKVPGETCIPRGEYRVVLTESRRFGQITPLLLEVPGFTGVRIHPGNTVEDTEGCLLVGTSRSGQEVRNSREAYEKLMKLLVVAGEVGIPVMLEIR
jgi:hypothetical protein